MFLTRTSTNDPEQMVDSASWVAVGPKAYYMRSAGFSLARLALARRSLLPRLHTDHTCTAECRESHTGDTWSMKDSCGPRAITTLCHRQSVDPAGSLSYYIYYLVQLENPTSPPVPH